MVLSSRRGDLIESGKREKVAPAPGWRDRDPDSLRESRVGETSTEPFSSLTCCVFFLRLFVNSVRLSFFVLLLLLHFCWFLSDLSLSLWSCSTSAWYSCKPRLASLVLDLKKREERERMVGADLFGVGVGSLSLSLSVCLRSREGAAIHSPSSF